MSDNRSRFVTLCQQFLVAGTVLAVTVPAVTAVSLDIVDPDEPQAAPGAPADASGESVVSATPVDPDVREVSIGGVDRAGLKALTASGAGAANGLRLAAGEDLAALSAPEPVEGYATVGVTWKSGVELEHDEISVWVRSREDGTWSGWQQMEYDDHHGPDPDSPEGRRARPGTDPVVVGDVEQVQVKATTDSGEAPADLELALIDPGESTSRAVEQPEIDTAKLASASTTASADAAMLTSGATPKPRIFSRKQWGADESLRGGSPSYYEVHAGFVHHTVNANSYTREQVPSLMRGIYAYHTRSRGWSDIGYNYIVDRFGRIWEGRYGGVDRPVVGAHTSGYNNDSFAMSALGNFDITPPSAAMVAAYGKLFAWKLSLHGIDAASMSQQVGSRSFPAVNGHRDAGQTACPGRYLYAKLGEIRARAVANQMPFTSRARQTSISGVAGADIVARDATTKKVYLLRTEESLGFNARRAAARNWRGMDLITTLGDVTRDGREDLLARDRRTKMAMVYPGNADGTFGPGIRRTGRYRYLDQLAGVSDMNHDGNVDLVGRDVRDDSLYFYGGRPRGGFKPRKLMARDWSWTTLLTGVGELSGDRHGDLLVRDRKGRLSVRRGDGHGGLMGRLVLRGRWGGHNIVTGLGDVTGDGVNDIMARGARSKITSIFPGKDSGGIGPALSRFGDFRDVSFLSVIGDVTGDGVDDLVGRGGGGNLVVFPHNNGGAATVDTGVTVNDANAVLNVGDWNSDGFGDVMTRSARNGRLYLYTGDGRGRLGSPQVAASGFGPVRLLAAVGDVTGDGDPDLMGQPSGGAMRIYPGNGAGGFRASYVAHSALAGVEQIGAGLWNGDGAPDTIVRRGDGALLLYPGNGPGGLMSPTRVGSDAGKYDAMTGVGDIDGDGSADLVARERSTGELWKLLGSSMRAELVGPGYGRYDLLG